MTGQPNTLSDDQPAALGALQPLGQCAASRPYRIGDALLGLLLRAEAIRGQMDKDPVRRGEGSLAYVAADQPNNPGPVCTGAK